MVDLEASGGKFCRCCLACGAFSSLNLSSFFDVRSTLFHRLLREAQLRWVHRRVPAPAFFAAAVGVNGGQRVAVMRQWRLSFELRVAVMLRLFSPRNDGAWTLGGRSAVW